MLQSELSSFLRKRKKEKHAVTHLLFINFVKPSGGIVLSELDKRLTTTTKKKWKRQRHNENRDDIRREWERTTKQQSADWRRSRRMATCLKIPRLTCPTGRCLESLRRDQTVETSSVDFGVHSLHTSWREVDKINANQKRETTTKRKMHRISKNAQMPSLSY